MLTVGVAENPSLGAVNIIENENNFPKHRLEKQDNSKKIYFEYFYQQVSRDWMWLGKRPGIVLLFG